MDGIIIGYDFKFTLVVKKRNGKTFHRHLMAGIGLNFSSALWDVYFKLKKRKTQILKITAAEPDRFCFSWRRIAKTQPSRLPACNPR